MSDVHGVARDQLRAFIERIERLEEEKKAIADDIKDVKGEAKGFGFDIGAINAIIKLRKKDANERAEEEAILDAYMAALGMIDQPSFFDEPHDRETGELSPRLAKQVVDGMQTEAGRSALMAAVDIMIEREEAEEQNSPETAVCDNLETVAQSPQKAVDELVGPEKGAAEAGGSGQPEAIPALTGQLPGANVSGPKRAGVTAVETAINSQSHDDAIAAVYLNEGPANATGVERSSCDHLASASHGEAEAQAPMDVSLPVDDRSGDGANTGGDHVDDHQSAATPAGALVNKAPAPGLLRPHCQRPEMCGSGTRDHCWNCKKLMREGDAA